MSYDSDPHGGAPGEKMSFPDDASPESMVRTFNRPAFARRNEAAEPHWNSHPTGMGEKVDRPHDGFPTRGPVPASNGPDDGGNTRYAGTTQNGAEAGYCTTNVSMPNLRQKGAPQGGTVAPPPPSNVTPRTRKPRS